MFPIPQCAFLTRGVGTHRHQLTAFEYALRDADIDRPGFQRDFERWIRRAER